MYFEWFLIIGITGDARLCGLSTVIYSYSLRFALKQGLLLRITWRFLLLVALYQSAGQALLLGFNLKSSIKILQAIGVDACAVECALQLQIFNEHIPMILG